MNLSIKCQPFPWRTGWHCSFIKEDNNGYDFSTA
nr:MAG TPA: hypothetical protein [Caudoviricetes sp.]